MRVAFEQKAVLERAGLHLIGVGDQVPGTRHLFRHETPFHSRREACAAAASEVRSFHLFDNLRGRHRTEHFTERLIPACSLIAFSIEGLTVARDVLGKRRLHRYLYRSRMFSALAGSRSRCRSSSTIMTGA